MAATIIVGAAIVIGVIFAVRHVKKKGTCSCGCGSCPMSSSCGKKKTKDESVFK